MADTITRAYAVQGMTCEHCRASVIEEVAEVEGVDEVGVDLASGLVKVSGQDFSDDAVQSAVEEAGYQLANGQ